MTSATTTPLRLVNVTDLDERQVTVVETPHATLAVDISKGEPFAVSLEDVLPWRTIDDAVYRRSMGELRACARAPTDAHRLYHNHGLAIYAHHFACGL
jgi:hypothetical protein